MKLIIDIPDNDYEKLKDGHIPFSILKVMQNGTPLPKNHGRLIDADALINYLNRDFLTFERELYYDVNPANALAEAFNIINDTSTIIEADKGEQE